MWNYLRCFLVSIPVPVMVKGFLKKNCFIKCFQLFIRPDAFCLIYAIPEEDADAFWGKKCQRSNFSSICFCGWEVQAETTAIRIVRFLCLDVNCVCEDQNILAPEFVPEGIYMVLMCRRMHKKCRQPNLSPQNRWQHYQQWLWSFPAAQADLPCLGLPNQWRFQWRRPVPDNSRRGSSSLCWPSSSCCMETLGTQRFLETLQEMTIWATWLNFMAKIC